MNALRVVEIPKSKTSWFRRLAVLAMLAAGTPACSADNSHSDQANPSSSVESSLGTTQPSEPNPPLADYETKLPHTTQPVLPAIERALLVDYLNRPRKVELVRALTDYHLLKSLISVGRERGGEAIRHSIFALYFLNRQKDLGVKAKVLDVTLTQVQSALNRVFNSSDPITMDEYHDAHVYYRRTFHFNQEQNRYKALDGLLQEFSKEPRNVYTSFAITALNLWVGGEADYDDPTTLYNFILGSYFSLHTISLSHQLEDAWNVDPVRTKRFRMAATLGGFGLLQRRWLAILHNDQPAIALIDDEHRAWYKIQPAFHSFPLGLPFFDEPENFDEGYAVYVSGIPSCSVIPVRTCSDLPRFRFNLLGFVLGIVDYSLKAGDLETARSYLNFRFDPAQAQAWNSWSIGRDPWLHREQNFDAIAALYANGELSDDPVNFEMKRRKWGEDTTTCQECHQIQAAPVSFDVVNEPQIPPPPEVASVRTWPPVTTAWYGASLR
jgi:hypothetical protein